jgi:hypothetical protein
MRTAHLVSAVYTFLKQPSTDTDSNVTLCLLSMYENSIHTA